MEPAYPILPVPDPDALARANLVGRLAASCLPDLVRLADDLAAWTENLDGGVLPPDVEDDLEQLGSRAHEILRRLREEGSA